MMQLRHENILVPNNFERSKIALLQLEMFKERQAIKRQIQMLQMIT